MITGSFFIKHMIELATGAAFLMSSLYGAGQANAQNSTVGTEPKTTTPIVRVMTDSKLVEAYVRREFSNTPILVEIARCESTFRQYDNTGQVIRGKVNSADVGVMQINEKYHVEDAYKLGHDIYSIEGNTAFAKYLFGKYGTSPWSSSSKCWSNGGSIAQK
ncbi:MAG: hypothetical protein NT077_04695 [Candidatus Taylorbacteria bacterium]|nr:hypothetical protein [Candidatus Taylorbacteria bacterium]